MKTEGKSVEVLEKFLSFAQTCLYEGDRLIGMLIVWRVEDSLTKFFMFFTLILVDNFLFLILANCVHDESCREKLVPTSPIGSNIQGAAVNSAQRCFFLAF